MEKTLALVESFSRKIKLLQIFRRLFKFVFKIKNQKFTSNASILELALLCAQIVKCIPINICTKPMQKPCEYTVSTIGLKYLQRLKYKSFVATSLVFILLLQCVQISTQTSSKVHDRVITWFTFGILATSTFNLQKFRQNSNEAVTYLNGIFQLDQRMSTNKSSSSSSLNEKLSRICALLAIFTGFVYSPLFVLGFHCTNPCKASLVGYQLIRECGSDGYSPYLLPYQYVWTRVKKMSIFTLNIWMWYFTINTTVFVAVVLLIIFPVITRNILQA